MLFDLIDEMNKQAEDTNSTGMMGYLGRSIYSLGSGAASLLVSA